MFKKFLSVLIISLAFISIKHSFAFTSWGNACNLTTDTEIVTVVSQADLSGNIPLCVKSGGTLPITVKDNNGNTIQTINSVDANGNAPFNYPWTFQTSDVGKAGGVPFTFSAYDSVGNISNPAGNLTVNVNPAPITLTIHNNTTGVDVPAGGSVNQGDSVSFTCTNSLNMYLDNQSGTNPPVSTYIGTNYTVGYTPTSLSGGSHTVGCTNIGTPTNDVSKSFTVISPDMSGTLSAPSCTIAAGASTCSTTFSLSIQNKEGNTTAVTASGVPDKIVSSSLTPSSQSGTYSDTIYYGTRTYFLYNNAKSLAQVDVSGVCASGSSWDGSKCVTVPLPTECPVGTPSGANAYPDCSCPSGTYQILPANVCAPCNAPNIYDAATHTCNAPGPIPYTHFLSFNVSGGYVPKGSKINLNWSIQKPNNTCNIVGVSLKDGSQVFNLLNYNAIVTPLLEAISNNSLLSVGDFTKIIGSGFTINQSTRLTASCIAPEGSYLPGYHQLVRDVYVTGEERN